MSKFNFTINGTYFKSKQAVIKYVQENIHSHYEDFELINDYDLRFMTDLLRYHKYADQKIGYGVKNMWLQFNLNYPTRGFWLERVDGSITDFSFYNCVNTPSRMDDFRAACRRSIAKHVINFKFKFFSNVKTAICPVLSTEMTSSNSHVDHDLPYPFETILNEFIKTNSIDIETAPLLEQQDGKIGNVFTDENFKNKWIEFHNQRAKLRVISAKANLSNG